MDIADDAAPSPNARSTACSPACSRTPPPPPHSYTGPLRSLGADVAHVAAHAVRPVSRADFSAALSAVRPSVPQDSLRELEQWNDNFGSKASVSGAGGAAAAWKKSSARSSARAPQLPTAGGTGAVARGWGAKLGLGGGRSGSKLRRSVSEVGTQGTRGGRAAGGATGSAAVPDYMTLAMPSGGPGGGTMAPPNLPERGRTQSARMGRGGGGGGGGGAGSGVSGSGVVSGGTFDSCCIA